MSQNDLIDWSIVFASLADADRRAILNYLTGEQDEVPLLDLAEHLAISGDDEAVQQARIQLHHAHLPKLSAAGLVVWSASEEWVKVTTLAYQLPVSAITANPVSATSVDTRQTSD